MREGESTSEIVEHEITAPWEGVLLEPAAGGTAGVVVLAGSSGRVERRRARLLAEQGLVALAVRWFGGPGGPPGICEVPLETFVAAVDLLRSRGVERTGVLGVSKGAEAALLTAVREPLVDVVVAVSPTALVWCNVGPGRDGRRHPYRSSWTWRGRPLPFVPLDDSWRPPEEDGGPVSVRDWYDLSERTFADRLEAAVIPVERARADVLLVAGGDDAMWSSLRYAEHLAARRRAVGAPVRLVTHADAGHRPRFPGEGPAESSRAFRYGGTPHADALLGELAWAPVLDALRPPGPVR
ncbi:acyl-CoA thioester hydrolase/BAAT C-terminal domain-containing protein [Streptomyces sp. NRRL B-24085]|uniref:acyl-CoA thioester hydrolase/BAAT C-terminal domain-containing protein n=1 Tax=Streptomyces sp. NRRL B-24085 TaxID=1709476 RepID=UPI0006B3B5DF|nr:acyl-CoA thioester hydrolase/BAAT C-terminal domain-containing protein [Streptomyces sp. NRRL B-24085]